MEALCSVALLLVLKRDVKHSTNGQNVQKHSSILHSYSWDSFTQLFPTSSFKYGFCAIGTIHLFQNCANIESTSKPYRLELFQRLYIATESSHGKNYKGKTCTQMMFQAWTQSQFQECSNFMRSNNFEQYYYFKCWLEINHKKNDVTDSNAFFEFTDFRSHKGKFEKSSNEQDLLTCNSTCIPNK